ncbi:hypothetical protein, partial [Gordonia sp. NPDC003585]|uniref:hypothetical protein n=1 Tax=Gordonia sp. NPDC003585 TaxID=3154275 RepID=UPI0033BD1513
INKKTWAKSWPPTGTYLTASGQSLLAVSGHFRGHPWAVFHGRRQTVEWVVKNDDIGESRTMVFTLRNASKYQRRNKIDDARQFVYHVNPPLNDD